MSSAAIFAKYIYNQGIESAVALNKFLYISFGFFGAYHDKFLFDDTIESRESGPVVPHLWHRLKNSPKEFAKLDPSLERDQETIINRVVNIYGKKAPYLLTELTYKENTPWSKALESGKEGAEIDKQVIIDYYKKLLEPIDKTVQRMMEPDFRAIMKELAKT